jgi:ubiquinone biosynthesis protein UbiJ
MEITSEKRMAVKTSEASRFADGFAPLSRAVKSLRAMRGRRKRKRKNLQLLDNAAE